MESKRTPGPWQVAYGKIITANTKEVGIAKMDRDEPSTMPTERDANAAYIVEACNNYERIKAERDELVAALRQIADFTNGYGDISKIVCKIARDALAKPDKEELQK